MNGKRLVLLLLIYQYTFLAEVNALEVPKHMISGAKKLINICLKETGANEDLFKDARATGLLPSNENVKCFVHCILYKTGLMDDDNIMHLENLLEVLPEEFAPLIKQLYTTCGTQSGADGCETSYLTVNCYLKTNPIISNILFAAYA